MGNDDIAGRILVASKGGGEAHRPLLFKPPYEDKALLAARDGGGLYLHIEGALSRKLLGGKGDLLLVIEVVFFACRGFRNFALGRIANPGAETAHRQVKVVDERLIAPCIDLFRRGIVPCDHHARLLCPSGHGNGEGLRLPLFQGELLAILVVAPFEGKHHLFRIEKPVAVLIVRPFDARIGSSIHSEGTQEIRTRGAVCMKLLVTLGDERQVSRNGGARHGGTRLGRRPRKDVGTQYPYPFSYYVRRKTSVVKRTTGAKLP